MKKEITYGKAKKAADYRKSTRSSVRRNRGYARRQCRPSAGADNCDALARDSVHSEARSSIPTDGSAPSKPGCQCQLRAPRSWVEIEQCCICGGDCDGSLIRHDTRYWRVHNMLMTPEIPRTTDGEGIKLCHSCQRRSFFRGGFVRYLVFILEGQSKHYRKSRYGAAA